MTFSYKKWVKLLLIIITSLYGITTLAVSVIIDPYGDLDILSFQKDKKRFFTSYSTTPIRLFERLNHKQYTLVFGTSRSVKINSSMIDGEVLNLSSGLYGHPADIYHTLRQLNDKQIENIKAIYYLVDTHTFENKQSIYANIDIHSKTEYFKQILISLNIDKIKQAITSIFYTMNDRQKYLADNGAYIVLKNESRFTIPQKKFLNHFRRPSYTKDSIKFLGKVDLFAKKNKINIKYFTATYSAWYLKRTSLSLYKKQYLAFLSVIDEIYDFHYMPSISNEKKNFSSSDHINTQTSQKIVNILKREDFDTTNKDNIDQKFKYLIEKFDYY